MTPTCVCAPSTPVITSSAAQEVAKARAEAAARGPPETPAAALPDEPAAAGELSDVQRELLREAASTDTCEACGRVAKVQVCTACKCVAYCSRPCQKRDWPTHKNACKALRAMRKTKTPAAAISDPAARQGSAQCFFLRGSLNLRTKNYAKAVQAYERGLALDPTDVVATMNLGIVLRNLGRHADAKPYLLKAYCAASFVRRRREAPRCRRDASLTARAGTSSIATMVRPATI